MTEEQLKISLETKKLKLSFWENITHFAVVGIFGLVLPLDIFFNIKNAINGITHKIDAVEIVFVMIFTITALLLYKSQSRKLKFQEVKTNLSRQELNGIIERVGTELKWFVTEADDKYLIAKTHPSFFSGSWGELITLLFDKNRVLINSICDTDKHPSVASYGRNKKNMNTLIDEINKAGQ